MERKKKQEKKSGTDEPDDSWAQRLAGNRCEARKQSQLRMEETGCLRNQYLGTSLTNNNEHRHSVCSQVTANNPYLDQGAVGDHNSVLKLQFELLKDLPHDTFNDQTINSCYGLLSHAQRHYSVHSKPVNCTGCHHRNCQPTAANPAWKYLCLDEYYYNYPKCNSKCAWCDKTTANECRNRRQHTDLSTQHFYFRHRDRSCSPETRFAKHSKRKTTERMSKNKKSYQEYNEHKKKECGKIKENENKQQIGECKEKILKLLSEKDSLRLIKIFDRYIDDLEKLKTCKKTQILNDSCTIQNEKESCEIKLIKKSKLKSKNQTLGRYETASLTSQYSLPTLHMLKKMKIREYKPAKPKEKLTEIKTKSNDIFKKNKQATEKIKNYEQYLKIYGQKSEVKKSTAVLKKPEHIIEQQKSEELELFKQQAKRSGKAQTLTRENGEVKETFQDGFKVTSNGKNIPPVAQIQQTESDEELHYECAESERPLHSLRDQGDLKEQYNQANTDEIYQVFHKAVKDFKATTKHHVGLRNAKIKGSKEFNFHYNSNNNRNSIQEKQQINQLGRENNQYQDQRKDSLQQGGNSTEYFQKRFSTQDEYNFSNKFKEMATKTSEYRSHIYEHEKEKFKNLKDTPIARELSIEYKFEPHDHSVESPQDKLFRTADDQLKVLKNEQNAKSNQLNENNDEIQENLDHQQQINTEFIATVPQRREVEQLQNFKENNIQSLGSLEKESIYFLKPYSSEERSTVESFRNKVGKVSQLKRWYRPVKQNKHADDRNHTGIETYTKNKETISLETSRECIKDKFGEAKFQTSSHDGSKQVMDPLMEIPTYRSSQNRNNQNLNEPNQTVGQTITTEGALKYLENFFKSFEQSDVNEKCFISVMAAATDLITNLSSCYNLSVNRKVLTSKETTTESKTTSKDRFTSNLAENITQGTQYKDPESTPDSSDMQFREQVRQPSDFCHSDESNKLGFNTQNEAQYSQLNEIIKKEVKHPDKIKELQMEDFAQGARYSTGKSNTTVFEIKSPAKWFLLSENTQEIPNLELTDSATIEFSKRDKDYSFGNEINNAELENSVSIMKHLETEDFSKELATDNFCEKDPSQYQTPASSNYCQTLKTDHRYQASRDNLMSFIPSTEFLNAPCAHYENDEKFKLNQQSNSETTRPAVFDLDEMPLKGILKCSSKLDNKQRVSSHLELFSKSSAVSFQQMEHMHLQEASSMAEKSKDQQYHKETETTATEYKFLHPITLPSQFWRNETITTQQQTYQDCQIETESEFEYDASQSAPILCTVEIPAFKQCSCMLGTYVTMMENCCKAKKLC